MQRRFFVMAGLFGAVAGCARVSESRLNPLNWFGRSETVDTDTTNVSADPRPLVSQVTDLRLEKVPGGAIIQATGLPDRQGFFGGELVQVSADATGLLSYQFRISPPATQTEPGPERSREVIVGLFVSEQSLAGVRRVQVSGAGNALAVSR